MTPQKLTPIAVALPVLLATAYACDMNLPTGGSTPSQGYTHDESSQSEDVTVYADFFNNTAQEITVAYDEYTYCNGSTLRDREIQHPVTTTSMNRGQTKNRYAYSTIKSYILGDLGGSLSRWKVD